MDETRTGGIRSFRFRLAAAFAGVGIAAAALTGLLVNAAFGSRFSSYLEEQREGRHEQLAVALADAYLRSGRWEPAELDRLASLVLMDGGTVRLEGAGGGTIWAPSSAVLGAEMAAMHRQMMETGPLGPERRLPIEVDEEVVGTAVVRLPEPGLLPQDRSFRAEVNRLLLLGGLAAGAAALGLGILLAGRATRPARELTRAARAFSRGERTRRVDLDTPDEFGEMARTFNVLADTVEEEDRLRKTFAADVAHELRTPLTILRSQVEALQDGVADPGPAALSSLHEEILRLARLTADLEALASADASAFALDPQPTLLRGLLEEAVREVAGLFTAQGLDLETDLSDVEIEADATRIRQIVANLLSNALKFTPPGGGVHVELTTEGPWAVIRVRDTGPGIPNDELPHVFDRFFRGRHARAGGSGIGLTVVQDLVRAHGGEVWIECPVAGGTMVTVRLPGAPDLVGVRERPTSDATKGGFS